MRTPRLIAGSVIVLLAALPGCSHGSHSAVPAMNSPLVTPKSVSPALIAPAPMAKTEILQPSVMQSASAKPMGDIEPLGYSQIPGLASFAAAAPDGSLWVLSTEPSGPDKYIWHYVNGTWTNIAGLASRLSVAPNGTLYAINSGGGAWAYSNGSWTSFGGGCRDLTAAADGTLYVISNGGGSDGAIWHYSGGAWSQQPGSGNRLAASSDTRTYSNPAGTITPGGFYVINSLGNIYYLGSSGYLQLPGSASAMALVNGGLFVLGYPTNVSGNALYYYNLDNPGWTAQGGSGVSISSDGNTLYVIGASGGIYASPITPNAQILVDASNVGAAISRDLVGAQSPYYLVDYTSGSFVSMYESIPIHFTTYGDDYYHWQNNTYCQPVMDAGLPSNEPPPIAANPNGKFDSFMTLFAQPANLDVMIHVPIGTNPSCNGRGDPSEAAAWVDYANNTKHYAIQYWELGLYPYATDNGDFGTPPYLYNTPSLYASIISQYYSAMKAKDPSIKVGVFLVPPGGNIPTPSWDTTVLAAPADFVEFYSNWQYYSSTHAGNPSDSDVLNNIAPVVRSMIASAKTELASAGKPNLPIIVDGLQQPDVENSQQANSIVTALAFGMALAEIAVSGSLETTLGIGGCTSFTYVAGEYGSTNFANPSLITTGLPAGPCPNAPAIPSGTLMPQGRAYQLANQFAVGGEHALTTSVTSQPSIRAYAATLGAGYAIWLFNLDQNNAVTTSVGVTHASKSSYTATTVLYGKAQYDAGVTTAPVSGSLGTVGNSFSITLQPWSMTVVRMQ